MCIIIAKPLGKKLPNKDTLKNCFVNNNDGAGFCYVKDNRIYLSKGYAKFKLFLRAVRKCIKKETPAILHFRIATIGEVSDTNCHPFIISNDKREVNKTESCTKLPIFAHNGTLDIRERKGKSDTRQFAKFIGDPVIRDNIFRNNNMMKMLENFIGHSKMAFMNRKGRIRMVGDFNEEDGIYFSNFSWRWTRTCVTATKTKWDREKKEWVSDEDDKDKKVVGDGQYPGYTGYYPGSYVKEREEEDKKKDDLKGTVKEIIYSKEDYAGKYPTKYTECEMCDKKEDVYYFTDVDCSLCEFCYHLYCDEEYEEEEEEEKLEVVNDKKDGESER